MSGLKADSATKAVIYMSIIMRERTSTTGEAKLSYNA